MNTKFIIDALDAYHSKRNGEIFVPEIRVGTGYENDEDEQRVDGWAMQCWPSYGIKSIIYEVKVRREDFLLEKRRPGKKRAAFNLCHEFYFVTPKESVINGKAELPRGCGWMTVDESGGVDYVVVAPFRPHQEPSWKFVGSLVRTVYRHLNPIRGFINSGKPTDALQNEAIDQAFKESCSKKPTLKRSDHA